MLRWTSRRAALQKEMEAHIAAETQENIDAGMSPEQARHAAMKKFGNELLALEHSREARRPATPSPWSSRSRSASAS
jgi:hypothetical protein